MQSTKSQQRVEPDPGLSPEEIRLIRHCREQKWGELTIQLKNGKPVMITRALENIKLDGVEVKD